MRKHLVAAFASLAFVSLGSPASSNAPCFTAQDSAKLPFEVIVQAPPPKAGGELNWRYHPANGAASADLAALSAPDAHSIKKFWYLWANRCHAQLTEEPESCGWNQKGNVVSPRLTASNGKEVRTFFSTFAAANNCTLIQAASALGSARPQLEKLAAAGKVMILSRAENPLQYVREGRLVDVCLLPETALPRSVDIVLDYEVQDRRTPQQSETFLLEFARLVKASGRKVFLYSNPLDAPTQQYTGLTPQNMPRISAAFDFVGITLWGRNKQGSLQRSMQAQLQMLENVPSDKIYVVYELNHTSMADAQHIHHLLIAKHFGALMLWRNYAEVGGACGTETNRKISCVVFGRCS
jgi:hypothetical protein